MRALILLLLIVPVVSANYLVVTLDVDGHSVSVADIELAYTASMRSYDTADHPVTIEIIDANWRSVSRGRISAAAIEAIDRDDHVSFEQAGRTRTTAIVPIDERARMLIVRSANTGRIIDLYSASCDPDPLCTNCARRYPEWCTRPRASATPFDPRLVAAIGLNVFVLSAIIVFLMARRR